MVSWLGCYWGNFSFPNAPDSLPLLLLPTGACCAQVLCRICSASLLQPARWCGVEGTLLMPLQCLCEYKMPQNCRLIKNRGLEHGHTEKHVSPGCTDGPCPHTASPGTASGLTTCLMPSLSCWVCVRNWRQGAAATAARDVCGGESGALGPFPRSAHHHLWERVIGALWHHQHLMSVPSLHRCCHWALLSQPSLDLVQWTVLCCCLPVAAHFSPGSPDRPSSFLRSGPYSQDGSQEAAEP